MYQALLVTSRYTRDEIYNTGAECKCAEMIEISISQLQIQMSHGSHGEIITCHFSHRWDMVRSSQRLRARRARTEKTCRATTAQSVTSSEQRSSLDRARDCVLSEISKLCRWSCTSATQPFSNCSNLSIAIQLWIGWRSLWTVKFACHLDKRMSRSSSTLSQVCITKLYCKLGEN